MTHTYICTRCNDVRHYVGVHPKPPICDRPFTETKEVTVTTPHYSYQSPSEKYVKTEKTVVRCNGTQVLQPNLPILTEMVSTARAARG